MKSLLGPNQSDEACGRYEFLKFIIADTDQSSF